MNLRVLQWNVWYKEKVPRIVEVLKTHPSDVICLQEVRKNSLWNNHVDTHAAIAKALGDEWHYVPAQVFPDGGTQGNAILSRLPFEATEALTLQETGKVLDASNEKRVLAAAEFSLDGCSFKVATTHLSYTRRFVETKQKKMEAEKLLSYLKKQEMPVIFTGDLNTTPESTTFRELSRVLQHAGPTLSEKSWTTKPFSYQGFEENKLNWRLDYIFCSSHFSVKRAEIIQTDASDHLPILATLALKSLPE